VSALAIRTMTRADLATALDWAAAENWNPGIDDTDAFLAADPDGFLMGFLGNEPIASISVVRYGERFGFLGFYICGPEFRGLGHGMALWKAGMAHLGERTVGLDGVVGQQANYQKSGFALAHRNIRYGGPASAEEVADSHILELEPSRPVGLAGAVVAYDRALFPGPREAFLRAWIAPPKRRTLVYVVDGEVRGYGSLRACREDHKVGPLLADSDAIAGRLFAALTGKLTGSSVYIDVPEPNAAARALAEDNGLKPVFETARMYRGPAPAEPLARIFGITTFELG
jgi:hypothetical protein